MTHKYNQLNSNNPIYTSISLLLLIMLTFSCRVDVSSQFKDTQNVEKIISNFSKEINAENHEMQIGFENENNRNSSVLRFKFDKVKLNLMDSTLTNRSKEFIREIYVEVKDKDAFDQFEILYFKDPEFKEEVSTELGSFSMNKIKHSFSKDDLN